MFLEHVNLTVSDLDRSIKFYADAFGFHVRWRGNTTGGTPAAHLGDDRCYIALFQAKYPGHTDSDYISVGVNHFGFVVDDLDAMRARLESLGISPTDDQDYEPGRRFYFKDHDGFEIELVQYAAAATSVSIAAESSKKLPAHAR